MDDIKELLKDHVKRHSEYQIDNFIVGNQGDAWAQYKQALREIEGRYEQVISLKERIELDDIKAKPFRRFYFTRRGAVKARIEKRVRARARLALDDNLKQTQRELDRFVKLAKALKEKIGEVDEIRRHELEIKSWFAKARKMAAVDLLTGGLNKSTVDLIFALPRDDRRRVMVEIANRPDPLKMLDL